MENKLILENILTLTKSLCMLYINGEIESANKDTRNFMEDGLKENLKLQEELFNLMMNNNMYNISNLSKKILKESLKKITQEKY